MVQPTQRRADDAPNL